MLTKTHATCAAGLATLALAGSAAAAPANQFAAALAKGPLYAGLAAFASGLLVSLTPCVYPMVAVTVSVFGAREATSRGEGALLSAAFVLGIIAMFVPLGVVAGLTGSLAGAVLQSPWVVSAISLVFLIMAAAMFGAFELDIPSSLKNKLAEIGGTGYLGAFLLGLACGPIAAPCTGPFLTGILAWITRTQSAALGAAAMASFALGLGVPFFLVGAFAVQLPKSGRWMVHVKSTLGLILVIVALYSLEQARFGFFAKIAHPTPRIFGVGPLAVALFGLSLGAIHKSFEGSTADKIRKGVGVFLTSFGGALFIVAATTPSRTLVWEHIPAKVAQAQALGSQRPLIVDFGAAWCGACKELDKVTFSEEHVQREAGRFLAVRVDATNDEDPNVEADMSDVRRQGPADRRDLRLQGSRSPPLHGLRRSRPVPRSAEESGLKRSGAGPLQRVRQRLSPGRSTCLLAHPVVPAFVGGRRPADRYDVANLWEDQISINHRDQGPGNYRRGRRQFPDESSAGGRDGLSAKPKHKLKASNPSDAVRRFWASVRPVSWQASDSAGSVRDDGG